MTPPPLSIPGLRDLEDNYRQDSRSHEDARPWLLQNMVTSIDGAIAIDGRSGGLGGPADLAVFRVLRSVCDVIVVGAGTARAENYGPAILTQPVQDARVARGQQPLPRIAVVTASARLDPATRLFANVDDPSQRPLILTGSDAPTEHTDALTPVADVLVAGTNNVDAATAMEVIDQAMAPVRRPNTSLIVLCEGGPTLNAEFLAADLVDEACWTISPLLVGGHGARMVQASPDTEPHEPRPFTLDRATTVDGMTFCRYLRRR